MGWWSRHSVAMSIRWIFLGLCWAADEITLSYKTTNVPGWVNEHAEAVIILTIYWGHGFYGANGWCLHSLLQNETTIGTWNTCKCLVSDFYVQNFSDAGVLNQSINDLSHSSLPCFCLPSCHSIHTMEHEFYECPEYLSNTPAEVERTEEYEYEVRSYFIF